MSTDYAELFYAAKNRLSFDALNPDDTELLVDLSQARGEYKQQKLLTILGLIGDAGLPDTALYNHHYLLLGGHIGCGKSTELRLLQRDLARYDRYYTVFIDIVEEMDANNLTYSDLLMAIGKILIQELQSEDIALEKEFISPLTTWAQEVINTKTESKILSSDLKSGAKGKIGLPFVGELFSHFTAAIRSNTTYKSEVREVVLDSFSQLADMFNKLIRHAEEQMRKANIARKILFIVDGTDRLTPDDAERFFNDGVMQLRQVKSSFIYCTKNQFLEQDGRPAQLFDLVRIPMIKLSEKSGEITDDQEAAWQAMREFVAKRISDEYFDNEATIDYLIKHSGGHLRDLVRLLDNCVNNTFGTQLITNGVARQSVKEMATEYRRLLKENDYQTLVKIDLNTEDEPSRTDDTSRMLENLLLLEYNSYWWRSHPLIQTLTGYQKVKQNHLSDTLSTDSNEN